MIPVFLSYSAHSKDLADSIQSVLEALGARVFNYRSPDGATALNADMRERLTDECSAARLFIQILEDGLGNVTVEGTSLMKQELKWYHDSTTPYSIPKPKALALVVGEAGEEVQRHLTEFRRDIREALCKDPPHALRVATGWYNRLRATERDVTAIQGHMDLEIAQPSVDKALGDALHQQSLIPQKLLYTSPFGAFFWRKLTNTKASSVRRLYDAIDYDSDDTEPLSQTLKEINSWDHRFPISMIALGCGDGRREAILMDKLVRSNPQRPVRVLLVDISKTLVAMAAQEFGLLANRRGIDLNIQFALADFEHPTTFSVLMGQWSPDYPVVIAFLGNTLGNINFSSFVSSVCSAMKDDDLLLTEITMAPEKLDKSDEAAIGKFARVSARHVDRFDFLCGPVRQLGVSPVRDNLRMRVDKEESHVRKTYAYKFDEHEAASVKSILNYQHKPGRLQLLRVDAFHEEPLLEELRPTLTVIGGKISRYPVKGIEHQYMGLFAAKRLSSG